MAPDLVRTKVGMRTTEVWLVKREPGLFCETRVWVGSAVESSARGRAASAVVLGGMLRRLFGSCQLRRMTGDNESFSYSTIPRRVLGGGLTFNWQLLNSPQYAPNRKIGPIRTWKGGLSLSGPPRTQL